MRVCKDFDTQNPLLLSVCLYLLPPNVYPNLSEFDALMEHETRALPSRSTPSCSPYIALAPHWKIPHDTFPPVGPGEKGEEMQPRLPFRAAPGDLLPLAFVVIPDSQERMRAGRNRNLRSGLNRTLPVNPDKACVSP